jgi:hypothetical protein
MFYLFKRDHESEGTESAMIDLGLTPPKKPQSKRATP